jgi:hypothetical protein
MLDCVVAALRFVVLAAGLGVLCASALPISATDMVRVIIRFIRFLSWKTKGKVEIAHQYTEPDTYRACLFSVLWNDLDYLCFINN